jgi:hypothetical protein
MVLNRQRQHKTCVNNSILLRIYSTLKLTHVIEYDRIPYNDTQTEWYEQEVTNYNQKQHVEHTSTSHMSDTGLAS